MGEAGAPVGNGSGGRTADGEYGCPGITRGGRTSTRVGSGIAASVCIQEGSRDSGGAETKSRRRGACSGVLRHALRSASTTRRNSLLSLLRRANTSDVRGDLKSAAVNKRCSPEQRPIREGASPSALRLA